MPAYGVLSSALLLLILASAWHPSLAEAGVQPDLDDYNDDDIISVGKAFQPKLELNDVPSAEKNSSAGPQYRRRPFKPLSYPLEMAAVVGMVLYVVNVVRGSRANKAIAVKFAQASCFDDGVLDQNFSFIGPGGDSPAKITKESASCFKLFASGRRFCQSLNITLDLIKRQDLVFNMVQLITPQDDELQIEVEMNEGAMPPLVMAVATIKAARQLVKDETTFPEVAGLTHKMEVARDRLPTWPSAQLTVLAEHSSQFYDLMPPSLADQVFCGGAFEACKSWFRSMLFSSERKGKDQHPQVLRFTFALPLEHDAATINRMLGFVMACIDLVGGYRLGPEQKKRSEKARLEWESEAAKAESSERTSAQEERRAAKELQELEKMRRMTPEARAKYQDRKQKLQQQRSMSKLIKRK